MKKILLFCLVSLCLLLSGCRQGKIDELVDMVNKDPTVYFGNYDDLQYVSSEYIAEKDGYYLLYQGKDTIYNVTRTYNLKAHFYNSNNEWILHDVEREIINTYLDIVGTKWKTTPQKGWTGYYNIGEDIKILDVAEDNENISIMLGNEKIVFIREHMGNDDIEFAYVSTNCKEQILLRYNYGYEKEEELLLYLDYKPSLFSRMPDLEYTLAE